MVGYCRGGGVCDLAVIVGLDRIAGQGWGAESAISEWSEDLTESPNTAVVVGSAISDN